jgi:uncharacterized protein involved in outer membrane biogenesis
MAKWTKRILLTIGILVVLLLAAAVLIPILFKDRIEAAVKREVNNNINAVVDWGDWDITLFRSFPHLTVDIEEVKLTNLEPFAGVRLAHIGKITATVDIKSLFGDKIDIRRIGLVRPHIHVTSPRATPRPPRKRSPTPPHRPSTSACANTGSRTAA